ncbi:MAG: glycosyltransferase family 2 protein, partial [Desulfovibrio sp.]|nr:glycosyltransferase family 2 protein [Desulfovibrio sp.]
MPKDPLEHKCELTILVTCYNESAFIGQTLETVVAALEASGKDWEVVVIDDCSRDGSAEIIRAFVAANPGKNIRFCPNEKNRGLANNFVEGAYLGRGKYYRLCCGDNPETFEALEHIFRHAGRADMVIPYQVQREVGGKSPLRKRISMLFTGLVNAISGNKVRYYNALPVFLRYHVMRYPPISCGFGFQADIVTRLLDEDISYMQIRHKGATDRKGKDATALTMRNLLSVVHSFVEIAIRRLRRKVYGKGMPRAREV